jgi:hypothetical protein
MRNLRKLRAFWTAAFAALAIIQAAHAWEHLKANSHPEHRHHSQDHQQQDDPVNGANDCDGTVCENAHSPAILSDCPAIIVEAFCAKFPVTWVSLPDSPVRKIDHPPQLS